MRRLACLAVALSFPATAVAEVDDFFLGDGHSGALTVTSAGMVVNAYAQLADAAAAGDGSLTVSTSTGFQAGDLVLVLQATGYAPTPDAGTPGPFDVSTGAVGHWELARLSAAGGTTLTLTAPLVSAFPALLTQVIDVPEYTTVTVNANARLTATPWDGSVGGVLAFLATGTVTVDGAIAADSLGFRGGAFVRDGSGTRGCADLDEPSPFGGEKGEGIVAAYGTAVSGYGNLVNGAGGGDCLSAGGGGGGNAGPGGVGGRSAAPDGSRPVGGLGGAAIGYSLLDHLTFGGGGGAADGEDGDGNVDEGGVGGGAIFIRAAALAGTGTLSANGGGVPQIGGGPDDGAAGGGAGGSVYLRFVGTVVCGGVEANGGNGGSLTSKDVGPGGGGGGGRILIQGSDVGGCATSVASGLAGQQGDGASQYGSNYGATPLDGGATGNAGTVTAITPGYAQGSTSGGSSGGSSGSASGSGGSGGATSAGGTGSGTGGATGSGSGASAGSGSGGSAGGASGSGSGSGTSAGSETGSGSASGGSAGSASGSGAASGAAPGASSGGSTGGLGDLSLRGTGCHCGSADAMVFWPAFLFAAALRRRRGYSRGR